MHHGVLWWPGSWYRAGVEHCIGQIKKFHILSSKYRGQLQKDVGVRFEWSNAVVSGYDARLVAKVPRAA